MGEDITLMEQETREIYEERVARFGSERDGLKKRSGFCVAGKLITFLLFAYLLYLACIATSPYTIGAAILLFAAYLCIVVLDNRLIARAEELNREMTVCQRELLAMDGDFSPFRDGARFADVEHEYTFDLDIFGKDSLFNRLNRTMTERGEEALAGKLSCLCQDKEEIGRNREAINELKDMLDWRLSLLSGNFIENSDFAHYGGNKQGRDLWVTTALPYVSVALTLALLVLGISRAISFFPFAVMALLQLLLGLSYSKGLTRSGLRASRLRKESEAYHTILYKLYGQEFRSVKMREIKHNLFSKEHDSLKAFRQLQRILNLIDQRSGAILLLVMNALCLYDLLLTRRIRRWGERYAGQIDGWTGEIAEFDALLSLSVYAYNNPQNTDAQVLDGSDTIVEARGMYHPFLPRDKAVANDFLLMRHSIAIVTGANMAGKSTFLRTVGVNYVLACCGAPVCAREFRFSIVSLFSSMRTTDNLSKDISYFNAELLRLERLIEHVKSHAFTLMILDEILKGTNSKDKLQGSTMFLTEICRYDVSGIVATHDLELARLEEQGSGTFTNYRFEIELAREIKYSYKISRGVARNMNASYLLSGIIDRLRGGADARNSGGGEARE